MRATTQIVGLIFVLFGIMGCYALRLISYEVHWVFVIVGSGLYFGSIMSSRRNGK